MVDLIITLTAKADVMENEIGIVTIEYTEDGLAKSATFNPTMKVVASDTLLNQLSKVDCSNSGDTVKNNAELVFAQWFSEINDIELADKMEYVIKGEVLKCDNYTNAKVKRCDIRFTFSKR